MKNIYIIFLVTVIFPMMTMFSNCCLAQEYKSNYNIFGTTKLMEKVYKDKEGFSTNHLTYEEIDGTPFLNIDFLKGEILTNDSILYTDINLRYDAYNESMQVKYKDKIYILGNTLDIKHVRIQDQYFFKLNFNDNTNLINDAYFKVLVDDSCSLYSRYRVKFYTTEKSNGFNTPKPDRFGEIYSNYYIKTDNDSSLHLIETKKNLLNLIDESGSVKNYMKKMKLRTNNEDDLIKIIKHYNNSRL